MSSRESGTVAVAMLSTAQETIAKYQTSSHPNQVLYIVATFVALISACHFFSTFYHFVTRRRVHNWNRRTSVSLTRVPSAVFDSFRALAFRWTIPFGSSHELNFAEVGVTLAYIGVLFSWTFVYTTPSTTPQTESHFYGNRAGRMAASQLPIMVALGMRNNIFSWVTGISYIKLNFLHRMSARVLLVLVWIHAAGRLTVGLKGFLAITFQWVQGGVVAATSLTLICFLTIRPIRQRNYEVFLIVHFFLALIFVLAVYFHVRSNDLLYYGALPSMVLWGLDYLIRFIRLALVNFGYLNPMSSESSKKEMDAVVEVLSPDVLRVTLHRSKHFHWRPGHSVYLSIPSISTLPFESHPFTISTINDKSRTDNNVLIFLLRVRKGFTQKLLHAASSPDQTHKVFLNGPYGSPPLLLGYQTVILIAGGSGVTFTLPFFLDIMRRVKAGESSCQRVLFVWAIRDSDHIHWIANSLAPAIENVPHHFSVSVQLYITTANNNIINNTEKVEKWDIGSNEGGLDMRSNDTHGSSTQSHSNILPSPLVHLRRGRPDLKAIISKEVADATGRISINVCGSRTLGNSARAAISTPRPMDILRGGPTVTLHVESHGGL